MLTTQEYFDQVITNPEMFAALVVKNNTDAVNGNLIREKITSRPVSAEQIMEILKPMIKAKDARVLNILNVPVIEGTLDEVYYKVLVSAVETGNKALQAKKAQARTTDREGGANWLGAVVGGVQGALAGLFPGMNQQPQPQNQNNQNNDQFNKILLYSGIGFGIIMLILVLIVAMKR